MKRGAPRWSPEELATLDRGLAAGLSARQIAAQLPGRTRAAVIGLARRRNEHWNRMVYVVGYQGEGIVWHANREAAITAGRRALTAGGEHWSRREVVELLQRVPQRDLTRWRFKD